MGHAIEAAALNRGHSIVATYEIDHPITAVSNLDDVDVCIDFSLPDAVLPNVEHVTALSKPLVIGTTGWYDHLPRVQEWIEKHQTGLIYAPNFSLGVNIFFQIVEKTAALFSYFPEYDAFVHEQHHCHKIDSPSGTALKLGDLLLENMASKRDIVSGDIQGEIRPEQLHISASRVGSVPGTHQVGFDGEADTITLTHTARNRNGFAQGAVTAADWIVGRTGLFTMRDLLNSYQNSEHSQ